MNEVVEAVLWLLAVFAFLYIVLWLLPAIWERIRAAQFARETALIEGTATPRRWSVGEPVRALGYWLAVKVLRLDRDSRHERWLNREAARRARQDARAVRKAASR